jgi:riboflavin kinase/FMN adenylyltransferase
VSGVFAVRVHGLGASPRAAVASIGTRPTVASEAQMLLEAFVFDFDEPIYGRRIGVELVHKLRDEQRFPDVETLRRRIADDVAIARRFFAERQAA